MKTVEKQLSLTAQERQQYEEQGFVVVRDVLSQEDVEKYRARAREFSQGKVPPGAEKMVIQDVRVAKGLVQVDDPEHGIWKYVNPDKHDELFAAYPSQKGLLDVVEPLIGGDIKAFLVMFIYKPPAMDFVHPFHQDAYYFKFEPHDLCCGTWLALDKTDAGNGTLVVIPGTHKLDLLPHVLREGNGIIYGVEGYDDHPNQVTLELEPGDAVFFHSRLLHKTESNTSEWRQRRVMTVHYASSKCTPITDNPYEQIQFRLVRGQSYEGCI